ncbi:MAG: SAM-dependent methyltransferase, partial [Aeromonas sp.]
MHRMTLPPIIAPVCLFQSQPREEGAHLYLAKVNLMLKSPLLPRFGDLVVAIVDDVLGQGLTLDRAYARHFSGIELKPQEQARIALVTG